jgi:hypothetical protein
MPVIYTRPLRKVLSPELETRLEHSLTAFPELAAHAITVGLTKTCAGTAEAPHMLIRLNVRRHTSVSYFTIGHELTHLLQSAGLRVVPDGEIQCDVWTLAKSELFLDDYPTYLCRGLWSRSNWPDHARAVRALCIQAIEMRRTNRRYLVWLNAAIEQLPRRKSPLRRLSELFTSATFRVGLLDEDGHYS